MYRLIPLEVFERSELPVLAVDAAGNVRYYNTSLATLAGCESGEWIGRPCWRFVRLKKSGGVPFCSRACPAMRAAREATGPGIHPVLFQRASRDPVPLTLLTFPVPPPRRGRWAMLHLLQAAADPAHDERTGIVRGAQVFASPPALARMPGRIDLLTRRERDILEALAQGLDVQAIADRSFTSVLTVRNHVQHILRKLHLHRQVDAILMLLARPHDAPREK